MYNLYFKPFLIILFFAFINNLQAQTNLGPGDIAIVGINTDNPDEFSFVLLIDIQAGTEIFFTDSGVLSGGSFRNSEGAILYTAPSSLNAGTVITFNGISGDFTNASDSNVGNNGFNLSASGDQIIAFSGTTDNPTFIFAVQTNSTVFQSSATNSNTSAIPPGLTVGTTAVAVGNGSGAGSEVDNAAYNLSVNTGNKNTLLAAIANNTLWNGSNTRLNLPENNDFTVTNGSTPPPTPTVFIQGNGVNINNGDTTPSNIDGTNFGEVTLTNNLSSTFSIVNPTNTTITVFAINITGTNASNFIVNSSSVNIPTSINTMETQNFTINFSGTNAGVSNAVVEILTNVTNISFNITANVISNTSITKISAIQGNNETSPMVNQTVTLEAIVVGDFQDGMGNGTNGDLNGFFVQEEDSDTDNDINTSEGIFVFDGFNPITNVSIGDKITITGEVVEFFGATQISNISTISIISSGNSLPTAATVNLPVPTITNADGALIPNLENVEGMLVNFPQSLTVTELFQLDRFGEVRLIQGNRPEQFTQNNAPSVAGFSAHIQDIASRSILLDDGLTSQNPDPIKFPDGSLSSTDAFRMGNTTQNITGVVAFTRGSGGSGTQNYRIHPVISPTFNTENTRPTSPIAVGGTLKIASFNVLNYFTTIDTNGTTTANGNDPRGADSTNEFNRQREKLLNALLAINADIVGLVELENDFFPTSTGNAIKNIVAGLNASLGINTYDWINPGVQFIGSDAIAVGIIYKPSAVSITSGSTIEILTDSNLPELGLGSFPAVFNGNSTNRAPLAVTFTENSTDEKFTVVVNHFKSKGSPGTSPIGDDNSNDGAGFANQTRLNASIALNAWINSDPTNSNDTDFLILGDLNAYANEAPITFLENEGYTDLARNFIGNSAYSFVFDGQTGTLDYALSSSSLTSHVTGATEWHVNADEADAIDYNLDFGRNATIFNNASPYRNSDHDPVIIGLDLGQISLNIEAFSTENTLNIFPIPFSNTLNISYNFTNKTTVNLYTLEGKKVISKTVIGNKNQTQINTLTLPTGVYLLSIENNNGIQFSKLLQK